MESTWEQEFHSLPSVEAKRQVSVRDHSSDRERPDGRTLEGGERKARMSVEQRFTSIEIPQSNSQGSGTSVSRRK